MRPGSFKASQWYWRATACASAAAMFGCGGGGGGSGSADPAPLDVSGVWYGNETSGGSAQGVVLIVGDNLVGVQTQGTTLRYFKATGYSGSDGVNYEFANARFDTSTNGGPVVTENSKIIGKYVPGTSPQQLFITVQGVGTLPSFSPMRMDPANSNVAAVADLRDYVGAFALLSGSLTLNASSAATGSFSATGFNGCNANGSLSLPRADRNVWTVNWTQSGCSDPARNGLTSRGLGLFYKSGATLNMMLLGEDGRAWTLATSSR